jgi:hypothetical protein
MATVTDIRNNRKSRGNKPKTVTEWRTYITEPWQNAVDSIIETGRRLLEAKDGVEYGEWGKIFKNNKPFSVVTAKKLICIAEHPVLSNRSHVNGLPPSWGTLYELSQIPEPLMLQMLEEGKIHPELTRREAEQLKNWEEQIKTQLLVIENSCQQAISHAPCDCLFLQGHIPQETIEQVQKVVDTWSDVKNYLIKLQAKPKSKEEVS